MNRFNEVTDKLKKMYKGNDKHKDKIINDLKQWLKMNRSSQDKNKIDAIKCFLAEKNIF